MAEALSAERRAAITSYYAATHYVDREAKRLVGELNSGEYLDNATVVFTADHGEELFDLGDFGRRLNLYDELIHVPLVVDDRSGRFQRSGEVSALTSHLNLAPTVTDLLNVDPPNRWCGESLTDLFSGRLRPTRTTSSRSCVTGVASVDQFNSRIWSRPFEQTGPSSSGTDSSMSNTCITYSRTWTNGRT